MVALQWRQVAARPELIATFGVKGFLRTTAARLIVLDSRCTDYLLAAPVAVLLVAARPYLYTGGDPVDYMVRGVRPWWSEQFGRGHKLRDFLQNLAHALDWGEFPAPGLYALRHIKGRALQIGHAPVLMALARALGPSELTQLIPPSMTRQRTWLRALAAWYDTYSRRRTLYAAPETEELLPLMARTARHTAISTAISGSHLADFMLDNKLDMRWSPEVVFRRCRDWSTQRYQQALIGTAAADGTAVVDYTPLPNAPVEISGGFTLRPLRALPDLVAEGLVMKNCVASYWEDINTVTADARTLIYSVRGVQHCATLELALYASSHPYVPQRLELVQLEGRRNTRPSPGVGRAVWAWIAEQNRALNASREQTLRDAAAPAGFEKTGYFHVCHDGESGNFLIPTTAPELAHGVCGRCGDHPDGYLPYCPACMLEQREGKVQQHPCVRCGWKVQRSIDPPYYLFCGRCGARDAEVRTIYGAR